MGSNFFHIRFLPICSRRKRHLKYLKSMACLKTFSRAVVVNDDDILVCNGIGSMEYILQYRKINITAVIHWKNESSATKRAMSQTSYHVNCQW